MQHDAAVDSRSCLVDASDSSFKFKQSVRAELSDAPYPGGLSKQISSRAKWHEQTSTFARRFTSKLLDCCNGTAYFTATALCLASVSGRKFHQTLGVSAQV